MDTAGRQPFVRILALGSLPKLLAPCNHRPRFSLVPLLARGVSSLGGVLSLNHNLDLNVLALTRGTPLPLL